MWTSSFYIQALSGFVTARPLDASRWPPGPYPLLDPSSSLAQIWMERGFHTHISSRTSLLQWRDHLRDIRRCPPLHLFSMVPAQVNVYFPLLVRSSLTCPLRYRPGWFRKYNFLLSAALDGGTEVMVFVFYFAVGGASGTAISMPNWALVSIQNELQTISVHFAKPTESSWKSRLLRSSPRLI